MASLLDVFRRFRRRGRSPQPGGLSLNDGGDVILGEILTSDFSLIAEEDERRKAEEIDNICYEGRKLALIDAVIYTRKLQVWRYAKFIPQPMSEPGWYLQTPPGQVGNPEEVNYIVSLLYHLGNIRFEHNIPPQRTIGELFASIADSILTYGKIAIRFWSDGKGICFGVIDPRYIYPINENLRPQKNPKAVYIRKPAPGAKELKYEEFEAHELLFIPMRGLYPFETSPTYRAYHLARAAEDILNHNAARFRTDRLPRGLLALLGNFAANTMKRLRRELQGISEQPTSPFVAHPYKRYPNVLVLQMNTGDVKFLPIDPSPKDMDYPGALYQLTVMVCARFGILPEELGIQSPVRPALSETSPEYAIRSSQEKGLEPLLEQIAHTLGLLIEHLAIWGKNENLLLYSIKITKWADFMTLQRIQAMFNLGLMTGVEAYSILERPLPFEHPYWHLPIAPALWLPYVIPELMAGASKEEESKGGGRKRTSD